jgi:hypothetical protein
MVALLKDAPLQLGIEGWLFYGGVTGSLPDEVSLYRQLEEWEKLHLHLLEKAYDLLKERIWAERRFAPF